MLIIPAIDLKDGQCVRLRQGEMDQVTVFSDDPVAMARHWVNLGAKRIHLVDLNGAVQGAPVNADAVKDIAQEVGNQAILELGGGIREMDTIDSYLSAGINSVIVGTAAVKQPEFLFESCRNFKGHMFVGVDARDGHLAVSGWEEITDVNAIKFAKVCADMGASAIIYTDIARDGMLGGVNIEATVAIAQALPIPVIASGGIATLADIEALCQTGQRNLCGAITGRAIYEGTLNFEEAVKLGNSFQEGPNPLLDPVIMPRH